MQLNSGETEITSDSGNNYDLCLVKLSSGSYKLIVFMKLQFFFEGTWKNAAEKRMFVQGWESAVKGKWGNRVLKTLKGGNTVILEFRFKTQIDGWMWDHWEITVSKIPKGDFKVSSVRDGWFFNTSSLDSEDLRLVSKGHGQSQRGVVHEFGHMLGLDDEYPSNSAHKNDYKSIMNRGEQILHRHQAGFIKWLDKELKLRGIQ